MAYKSELERFDMERGDVLSIPREACIELRELQDDMTKVIKPLICYVAGDPGDPVPEVEEDDPRMKRVFTGILLRMIEHQKKNAARRADYLAKQRENANKRWHNEDAKISDGIPRHTTATSISISKVEGQVQGKLVPSTLQPNELGQAAGGPCVTAAPDGTRTATRVAYVEPLSGDRIEARTFAEADLMERPVTFMLDAIGESDELQTRNALKKAVEELGPEAYARTCWRFVADMVETENAAAAVLAKSRANFAKRYGDDGEARLVKTLRDIMKRGSTNPENDWFVLPWMKWREFQPGRFLMGALSEAKLAAGIQTKRKPNGKRKVGE